MKHLLLVPLFLALTAVAAEPVPKPMDLGTSEISVCVAVPNLQSLLDNSDTFLAPFLGDAAKPGGIKAALGGVLKDPQLTGIDLTKPAVFALFKAPPIAAPGVEPQWAAFIPATSADAFAAQLQRVGLTSFENNLLIVAGSADSLKKGQAQQAVYAKIAGANLKSNARVLINVTNLLDTYSPLIKTRFEAFVPMIGMGMAMGKPDADPMAIQKMLRLEGQTVAALVSQIDVIQHDITLKSDSLQIETIYAAKDGTPLAELLSAPPAGKPKTLGLYAKPGMLTAVVRCDPAKYSSAINQFVADLSKDPAFADVLDDSAKALVKQVTGVFGGEYSTSVSIAADTGLDQQFAGTTPDEKAYMDAVKAMFDQFKPDAPLGKMYASMGMKMNIALDENVREHGGVQINRRKLDIDAKGMTPDQAASLKAMAKDADVATSHGLFLSATSPDTLDAMLDKLADPAPKKDVELKSVKAFGEGKQFYLDADWSGLLKAVIALQPNNPAAMFLGRMKSTEPVVMAGNFDGGRLFIQSNVPTAPFTDLAAAARPLMMMMGRRQRPERPPAPPEPDKKKDDSF